MSNDAEQQGQKRGKKRRKLLMPLAAVVLGGVGFFSTYLGLLPSPGGKAEAKPAVHKVEFVDIPTIELPIPGTRHRMVIVSAAIETDALHKSEVEHMMPRVQDAFTSFLSDVDESAYEKRGVLEILRSELVTRTRFVLGEEPVKDLLITEFRIK
ncbi:flagellar basal body-associated FliL family protein [Paracoccus onubensis]|uniref:flagellar basal body-associated FliL family protein n=1 Tax=Paracoccus onubensis TaxID=1675788 RepID=UPI002731588D|nr:flagellar basal body-associated FliL family protein [Paracoccus onubensis]MDP0925753.1 flagellar basal body-associated FliL family protein [Paracoccus onubensis]